MWQRIMDGAASLPGVTSVAVAIQAPYSGTRISSMYRPEPPAGQAAAADEEGEFITTLIASGDYVRTVGTRVVRGRGPRAHR